MFTFHGTSANVASSLAAGGVSVALGGGELGLGFYTGEHLHEAKAWAVHQSGDRQRNVVMFDLPENELEQLSVTLLDHRTAALRRAELKASGQTRTFHFGVDMVWAPIVGSDRATGDQHKWESATSEMLLNGPSTARTVV